jgi:hypothetical protein
VEKKPMPQFITLAGKKQTGKDTSANIISELLTNNGYKVHIIHFADSLKDACAIMFGIDREDMNSEIGKNKLTDVLWPGRRDPSQPWHANLYGHKYMTIRELLQFVGTDLLRTQLDPDLWVKSVFRKKYNDDDIVIVADCRFPNEAEFAGKHGLLVKIERDNAPSQDSHISERALDNYTSFDLVIENNSDLESLKLKWIESLRSFNFKL